MSTKPALRPSDLAPILGDQVLCRCGATLATYADACTAPLDGRCEGFERIEAELRKAEAARQ